MANTNFNQPWMKQAVQSLLENATPLDTVFNTSQEVEYLTSNGTHTLNAFQHEMTRLLNSSANDTNKLIVSMLLGMTQYNQTIMESVQALTHEICTLKEALPPKETQPLNSLDAQLDELATIIKSSPAPPPTQPIIIQPPPPPPAPKAPESYAAALKADSNTPQPGKKSKTKKKGTPRAPPVREKALPHAQRRFFATRSFPVPLPNASKLPIELPSILGNLFARNGQVAPATSLTITVNPSGTVTVLAPLTIPSSQYAPFFNSMTQALNAWAGTPENPYALFRPALTNVDIAIHGIPLSAIPNNEALNKVFPEAVTLATGIKPAACKFLIKDPTIKTTKTSSSVVISTIPEEATKIGNSLRLFSKPRRCTVLTPATANTICHRCCLLGHPTTSCKREPRCALCTKDHLTSTHRCPVPTCPGASKPLENCCEVSPAKCPNCLKNHSALNPSCPCRVHQGSATYTAPPISHVPMETEL